MTQAPLPSKIVVGDLVIRPWAVGDADAMAAMIAGSLDHLRPWMAWAHDEPISRRARLRLFDRWDRDRAAGRGAVYAVEFAGELVGGCALHRRAGPRTIDIGYWLAREGTGRGIATRTARALTEAAFELDDIRVVQISHAASNTRSGEIAQRLGFEEVTADGERSVTTWRQRRGDDVREPNESQAG